MLHGKDEEVKPGCHSCHLGTCDHDTAGVSVVLLVFQDFSAIVQTAFHF